MYFLMLGSNPSPDSDKGPKMLPICRLTTRCRAHVMLIHPTWFDSHTFFAHCNDFFFFQVTASSSDQSLASSCVSSAWEKCPPMTCHLSESGASRETPNQLYRAGPVPVQHKQIKYHFSWSFSPTFLYTQTKCLLLFV